MEHNSVLQTEAVDALITDPSGVYVDCTFGRGGHSGAILERLTPEGRLIALDRDPDAIRFGAARFAAEPRLTLVHSRFGALAEVPALVERAGQVSGVLFDLGVSSPQLDEPERGFSFQHDGPLDMRMDTTRGMSAADWLQQASEGEIADVLYHYGEERFARRMARALVAARREAPLTRTRQVADIIKQANPAWERDRHPATRAFQALRIQVNQELEEIRVALPQAVSLLRPGGRLAVISFHSLEDRMVKKFIALQIKGDEFPRDLPIPQRQLRPTLRGVGKAVRPGASEIAANPRARSAIMRVASRLEDAAGDPQR